MNPLPTFPERFVNDFFEPARRELEPTGADRNQILQTARQRASQTLGYQVQVSRACLYKYLKRV